MWDNLDFSFLIPSPVFGWYQLFKDFQYILVGLIGFSGVIITLVVNARISRKARKEAADSERRALRAALFAELGFNKTRYANMIETLNAMKGDRMGMPIDTVDTFYYGMIDRLGILSPQELTAIIPAYARMTSLKMGLRFQFKEHHTGNIVVEQSKVPWIIDAVKHVIPSVEAAIAELEKKG